MWVVELIIDFFICDFFGILYRHPFWSLLVVIIIVGIAGVFVL